MLVTVDQDYAEPHTDAAPGRIVGIAGTDREPEATRPVMDDPVRVRIDGGQGVDDARDTVKAGRVVALQPQFPVPEVGGFALRVHTIPGCLADVEPGAHRWHST